MMYNSTNSRWTMLRPIGQYRNRSSPLHLPHRTLIGRPRLCPPFPNQRLRPRESKLLLFLSNKPYRLRYQRRFLRLYPRHKPLEALHSIQCGRLSSKTSVYYPEYQRLV